MYHDARLAVWFEAPLVSCRQSGLLIGLPACFAEIPGVQGRLAERRSMVVSVSVTDSPCRGLSACSSSLPQASAESNAVAERATSAV